MMFRKVLILVIPLILLSMMLAQLSSARVFRNTFEHDAYLSHGGRFVNVVAEIQCSAGERVSVEVILSQGHEEIPDAAPNSLGRGYALANCAGDGQSQFIKVRVIALGRETFVAGPAKATGIAITTSRGQRTDVRQWQPAAGITIH